MAGKKKSYAKKSKSRGDVTLGKSETDPKVEYSEETKIQPGKRRKGVDGVTAEAENDTDSENDVPQVEGKVDKTNDQSRKRRKGVDEEMVEAYSSSPDKGSYVLRQRKQIPTFRKVVLVESDFKKILGKRIKVYWPESRRWFVGRIDSFDRRKKVHTVLYDDGEKENLNLNNERFELEVVPDDGFTLSSEKTNLKKDMGFNGGGVRKENKEDKSLNVGVTAAEPEKGSLLLRPRKQIPTFRKVNLSESDFKRIVGMRIKIFWPGSRKWFAGVVNSFNNKKKVHTVYYDDGDKEDLNLNVERFELKVVPSDGFTFCSDLRADFKKKEMDSNGAGFSKEAKEENSFKMGVSATGPDKVSLAGVTAGEPEKGSLCLRPRKQIPTFRKVALSESDFKKIVGMRIKVYWPDSRKWFVGRVSSFDSKKKLHTVCYVDGDVENLVLMSERFELEVVPDDGFTLLSKVGSNLKEKELGSNGDDICKEMEEEVKLSSETASGKKLASKATKGSSELQATNDCVSDKNENGETLIKEKEESESSEPASNKVKEMQSEEVNILAGKVQKDTEVAELEINEAVTV